MLDLVKKFACSCDESTMYDKLLLPEKGRGMWVWMEGDSEPYLDLVMGYSALNFGHSNPAISSAVKIAADNIAQIHSFHTSNKLLLSEYLVNAMDSKNPFKVYFDVGGASVVSAAVRLCRTFTGRKAIITFSDAFHGTNITAAAVTDDNLVNKDQYGLNISDHIIRLPFPDKNGELTTDDIMLLIRENIQKHQPAAVIVEPIQGAAGFIIPHDDFLKRLRAITEETGTLLIVDEIQMGMGRSGYLYTFKHWNIDPDIVLISKSLAGGYYPLSAIIARSELYDKVPKSGTAFQSTFNNNPFGIAIARKVLEVAEKENYFPQVADKGEKLLAGLAFLQHTPYIENLRGFGLALAFDFMDYKDFSSSQLTSKFVKIALEEKILIYVSGAGQNIIKISPPIIINEEEIAIIVNKLKGCFKIIENEINTIEVSIDNGRHY